MEDIPELWGSRIWFVFKQTSPICSYLPLTHVVPISTQRVPLPHFPLTQSEFSLHNLQAWTPSSVRFGGFIICYILVVLENGDCYWCWNQHWKDACLLVGDGKRQRRAVWCKMEVMVSLSFSSKYYQLIHINRPCCCKFLLNEHQLPCLSFPASLMYLLLMPQSALPSPPLLPMCLRHQDMASLPPHVQYSSHPGWPPSSLPITHFWQQHLPWKTVNASRPHRATMTETLGMARTVSCPWMQHAWCHQHLPRSHPGWQWAFAWCIATLLCRSCPTAHGASLCWVGTALAASRGHLWPKQQRANLWCENSHKALLKLIYDSQKVFTWKKQIHLLTQEPWPLPSIFFLSELAPSFSKTIHSGNSAEGAQHLLPNEST